MGINDCISTYLIYMIILCIVMSLVQCVQYKDNTGLTLGAGTALGNNTGVSIIQCISLCEQMDNCYLVLWREQSMFCSYHHWLIPGSSPAGYRSIYLSYGTSDDHVIFVKPILVFHMDTNYALSLSAGEAFCQSIGTTIASLDQLIEAKDSGYYVCACGFVSNGNAYYPMTYPLVGCGNSVDIQSCGNGPYNVFCTTQ